MAGRAASWSLFSANKKEVAVGPMDADEAPFPDADRQNGATLPQMLPQRKIGFDFNEREVAKYQVSKRVTHRAPMAWPSRI
jgi:hypothetical protein